MELHRWVFVLLFPLAAVLAAAQAPNPPSLDDAAVLARAGDWPAAAAAYQAIVAAEPEDARAWFGLGVARQERGEHAAALERAEVLGFPNRALLLLRKARAQARLAQPDAAFATIEALARVGYANTELLESDPDFAPLRSDARFTELLARPPQHAGLLGPAGIPPVRFLGRRMGRLSRGRRRARRPQPHRADPEPLRDPGELDR